MFVGGKKGSRSGKGGHDRSRVQGPPVPQHAMSAASGAPPPSLISPHEAAIYEEMFGPANDDEAVRNLMINYIPNKATEEDLHMVFKVYGPVEHIRVICDKITHEPRGYGFVKYMYGFSAYAAVTFLNGYQVFHKRLRVSYADENKAYSLISDPTYPRKWTQQQPRFLEFYGSMKPIYSQFIRHEQDRIEYDARRANPGLAFGAPGYLGEAGGIHPFGFAAHHHMGSPHASSESMDNMVHALHG